VREAVSDKPKVFISYAREDYETAKRLYDDLKDSGISPWMDKVDLVPGQIWKSAVTKAIKQSRFFLALLSPRSVSKRGFFHTELKKALEVFDEFSDEKIFLIPLLIDNCDIPEKLEHIHCTELFPDYDKTMNSILRVIQADQEAEASKSVSEKPEASQFDLLMTSTVTAQSSNMQGVIPAGTIQKVEQHFHGMLSPDLGNERKAVQEKPELVETSPMKIKLVSESNAQEIKRDSRFIAYYDGTIPHIGALAIILLIGTAGPPMAGWNCLALQRFSTIALLPISEIYPLPAALKENDQIINCCSAPAKRACR